MDTGTSCRKVRDDVSGVLRIAVDLDLHDWLKDDRLALVVGGLESKDGGHTEGLFVGVYWMVLTIGKDTFDTDDWEASEWTALKGFEETFLNGREVVLWNCAAEDFLSELVLFAWLEAHRDDTIEAAAAGLLDVSSFGFARAFDGFAVDDFHRAGLKLDLIGVFELLDDEVDVRGGNAAKKELFGLVVTDDFDAWVLYPFKIKFYGLGRAQ